MFAFQNFGRKKNGKHDRNLATRFSATNQNKKCSDIAHPTLFLFISLNALSVLEPKISKSCLVKLTFRRSALNDIIRDFTVTTA